MNATSFIILAFVMMAIGLGSIAVVIKVMRRRGLVEYLALGFASALVLASAGLIGLVLIASPGAPSASKTFEGGMAAPPLELVDVESGDQIRLADLRGEVVLLNVWATWCAPCVRELPELRAIEEHFRGRPVRVVMVSDEDQETLAAFEAKEELVEMSLRIADRDEVESPLRSGLWTRPTTFVIDREGRVQERLVGVQDEEQFARAVERWL